MNIPDHLTLRGQFTIPVYYEDTDFSGYVYHANYLKFFERAREQILGQELLLEMLHRHLHFVVKSAHIDYMSPAKFADQLIIVSEAPLTRSPLIAFTQKAFLEGVPGGFEGKPLAAGTLEIVVINHHGRPVRMPDDIFDEFARKCER